MRKQTRRKIWSRVNPIVHALEGAMLIPEAELDKLRVRELAAIEAFRTGAATLQEWHDVAAYMNLCESLAIEGVGPEALPACKELEQYLIEAARRFERTGKMGLSGPGLVAAREVYAFHDLQRQSVARSVYERVIGKMKGKISSKAAGVYVI